MKVAILSESPADESAICVLVHALIGIQIEPIPRRARPGGWNAAVEAIPPTLKELHFRRTAAALVVVIDSDNSTVHRAEHEQPEKAIPTCRLCELRKLVKQMRGQRQQRPGFQPIEVAIAVAVPAIEAWYLCCRECSEATRLMKQNEGTRAKAEIDRLKRLAYGTDRPSLQLEITRATEHANRQAANLEALEQLFPDSFGQFAAEVRSWLPR